MRKITVNASMEDVEKTMLKLLPEVFFPRQTTVIKNDKVFIGQVGIEIVKAGDSILWITDKYIERGKPKKLTWGYAVLNANNNRTTISLQLSLESIESYCKQNFAGYEISTFNRKTKFYKRRIEIFLEKLAQELGQVKSKRVATLTKEREVIKVYKAMGKRSQQDFDWALHSEDVRHKVTGQDVYDKIGAKVGLKKRSIEKIIQAYKETLKP